MLSLTLSLGKILYVNHGAQIMIVMQLSHFGGAEHTDAGSRRQTYCILILRTEPPNSEAKSQRNEVEMREGIGR